MKRMSALLMALGFLVVCSGAALAGEGAECGYKAHATQAGVNKVDAPAQAVGAASDKAEADKVLLAQSDKAGKPAVEIKK